MVNILKSLKVPPPCVIVSKNTHGCSFKSPISFHFIAKQASPIMNYHNLEPIIVSIILWIDVE